MKFALIGGSLLALLAQSCKTRNFESSSGDKSNFLRALGQEVNPDEIPLLDVNDISVLYPNTAFTPLSDVMTESDFQAVLGFGEGKGPQGNEIGFSADAKSINNWKIVSFRYDACAPGTHAAATMAVQIQPPQEKETICRGQLRLIAQPFAAGSNTEEDVTFHLLYALSRSDDQLKAQLNGIKAIKEASKAAGAGTDGVALSVHPGLATGNPAVIKARNDFIAAFAKKEALQSVAAMALAGGGPEPWVFYATFRNPATKQFVQTPIPTIGQNNDTPFQALAFIGPDRVIGTPSALTQFGFPGAPIPFTRESITPRSTHAVFTSQGFNDQNIIKMNDNQLSRLHAIDNPLENHFFTMDCVSCHSSTNLLLRRFASAQADAAEKKLIRESVSKRFPIPQGITGFVNLKDAPTDATFGRPWTVRNFGYFNGKPVIAFRTVTESAEVVQDINTDMLARPKAGPNEKMNSLSAQDYAAAEPKIWACMAFSNTSFDACFAQATGAGQGNGGGGGAGGNCTDAPPATALAQMTQVGRIFTLVHGPNNNSSQFAANAQVNEPVNFPAAEVRLGGALEAKFFLRHSDTDSSNMGLRKTSADGKSLEGIRYNMKFKEGQDKVTLTWKCDKWEGKLGSDTVSIFKAP